MKDFQLNLITNKQTYRILKILNIFEHHTDTTLSLKTINSKLKIPTRTLIQDISSIKQLFEHSVLLESSINGYFFKISNRTEYTESKRALLKDEPLFTILENIFFARFYTISELSDNLHLSESTLLRYLKKIIALISEYNLTIETSPVDIKGEEINIRYFFYNFYFESEVTPHTIFPTIAVKEVTAILTEKITMDECKPTTYESFNYSLYITLTRFFNNKNIEDRISIPFNIDREKWSKYLDAMKSTILRYYKTDLSIEEIEYIYLLTISRRSIFDETSEHAFQSIIPYSKEADNITTQYLSFLKVNMQLYKKFYTFLYSFFLSIDLKYKLTPILLQNIYEVTEYAKQNFSEEYHKNKIFIHDTVEKKYNISSRQSEDISANLTLFTDSLFLMYSNYQKHIIFILEGNPNICQHIQATAEKYLGDRHHLYFSNKHGTNIYKVRDIKFDVLVTNYAENLTNTLESKSSILFDTIPTRDDWYNLFSLINPRTNNVQFLKNF